MITVKEMLLTHYEQSHNVDRRTAHKAFNRFMGTLPIQLTGKGA